MDDRFIWAFYLSNDLVRNSLHKSKKNKKKKIVDWQERKVQGWNVQKKKKKKQLKSIWKDKNKSIFGVIMKKKLKLVFVYLYQLGAPNKPHTKTTTKTRSTIDSKINKVDWISFLNVHFSACFWFAAYFYIGFLLLLIMRARDFPLITVNRIKHYLWIIPLMSEKKTIWDNIAFEETWRVAAKYWHNRVERRVRDLNFSNELICIFLGFLWAFF